LEPRCCWAVLLWKTTTLMITGSIFEFGFLSPQDRRRRARRHQRITAEPNNPLSRRKPSKRRANDASGIKAQGSGGTRSGTIPQSRYAPRGMLPNHQPQSWMVIGSGGWQFRWRTRAVKAEVNRRTLISNVFRTIRPDSSADSTDMRTERTLDSASRRWVGLRDPESAPRSLSS
jgi:hypothetical protein